MKCIYTFNVMIQHNYNNYTVHYKLLLFYFIENTISVSLHANILIGSVDSSILYFCRSNPITLST